MNRLLSLAALCGSLLFLAACSEDATTVGIDLIEEQSGDPFVVNVTPTSLAATERTDITGNMPRILAGRVTDPLLGTYTATGYFDFTAPTDVPDEFRTGPINEVVLVLRPNYVYGDTTATISLNLRDIPTSWDELGVGADTTITTSDLITTISFAATDTLINVTMPQDWITRQSDLLRGENFIEDFFGIAFEVADGSGNAVIGFETTNTGIEITSGGELERYGVVQTVTSIRNEGSTSIDVPVLRDGLSSGVAVSFDLDAANLGANPVNRAVMRFPLDDAMRTADLPANFVRPQLERVGLFAVVEDSDPQLIEEIAPDEDGTLTFTDASIQRAIQRTLLGTDTFEEYLLAIPSSLNTLDVLFFDRIIADSPDGPTLVLTITPTE